VDRDKNERPAKNHRRDAYAPLVDDPLRDVSAEEVDGETGSPWCCPLLGSGPFVELGANARKATSRAKGEG
jgi:hypothetical protein